MLYNIVYVGAIMQPHSRPVLQHFSIFQRTNSAFLSHEINISISISQISAKQIGPQVGGCTCGV
jgi:hypothetical protein